jgi:hypothetical protein
MAIAKRWWVGSEVFTIILMLVKLLFWSTLFTLGPELQNQLKIISVQIWRSFSNMNSDWMSWAQI